MMIIHIFANGVKHMADTHHIDVFPSALLVDLRDGL